MSSGPAIAEVRVAVVDDEPTVAQTIARLLREEGWEVTTFDDPRRAAARLTGRQPDVLVVDYDMPGLTGAALVRRLRDEADGPSAPAVLVTGNRGGVPVDDRAPFEAILEKPFDPAHLVQLVEYCAYVRSNSKGRSGTRRRASVAFERVVDDVEDATGEGSTD